MAHVYCFVVFDTFIDVAISVDFYCCYRICFHVAGAYVHVEFKICLTDRLISDSLMCPILNSSVHSLS